MKKILIKTDLMMHLLLQSKGRGVGVLFIEKLRFR